MHCAAAGCQAAARAWHVRWLHSVRRPTSPFNLLAVRLRRFRETKGGDFGLVHPAPLMKGLLTEEAACEDLASVLNMVRGGGRVERGESGRERSNGF